MTTYALVPAVLVLGIILPPLVRVVGRILNRLPILGAVAALGVLYVLSPNLADGGSASPVVEPAEPELSTASPWAEDPNRQKDTGDDHMVHAYFAERDRFARELETAKQAMRDLIGL